MRRRFPRTNKTRGRTHRRHLSWYRTRRRRRRMRTECLAKHIIAAADPL